MLTGINNYYVKRQRLEAVYYKHSVGQSMGQLANRH